MTIELWQRSGTPKLIKSVTTNADGRIDVPLLAAEEMTKGAFELVFKVRDYFTTRGVECSFLDEVPIRFSISNPSANYHVPLLVTPWGYSTYRGS